MSLFSSDPRLKLSRNLLDEDYYRLANHMLADVSKDYDEWSLEDKITLIEFYITSEKKDLKTLYHKFFKILGGEYDLERVMNGARVRLNKLKSNYGTLPPAYREYLKPGQEIRYHWRDHTRYKTSVCREGEIYTVNEMEWIAYRIEGG